MFAFLYFLKFRDPHKSAKLTPYYCFYGRPVSPSILASVLHLYERNKLKLDTYNTTPTPISVGVEKMRLAHH